MDELKTVHMTASACTAMFTNGIADAKIAIEKMTVEQSIAFMRGVVGNTLRDPSRQFFSAAFNLFTPISYNNGTTVRQRKAGEPQICPVRPCTQLPLVISACRCTGGHPTSTLCPPALGTTLVTLAAPHAVVHPVGYGQDGPRILGHPHRCGRWI